MTNEKEAPEWYEDGKYWVPQPERYGHHWPKLNKIVAEAMRRGEEKAWEEAKRIVEEQGDICETANILPPIEEARRSGMASGAKGVVTLLVRRIDAKLKSLT